MPNPELQETTNTPVASISEMLTSYKKDDLVAKAKSLHLTYSGLNKAALSEKIKNAILSVPTMQEKLLRLDEEELAAFEQALDRGLFIPSEEEWDFLGGAFLQDYVATFDDDTVAVPADVAEAFRAAVTPEFRDHHTKFSWMNECLDAMAWLYSVAPVDVMWQMYRVREGFNVSREEFIALVDEATDNRFGIVRVDDVLVYPEILKDDLYKQIMENQNRYGYAIPTEQEIHDLYEYEYPYSDQYYSAFRNFIETEFNLPAEAADSITGEVYSSISEGGMPSDVIEILNDNDINFASEAQIQQFVPLLMTLSNQTRRYNLGGHRPADTSSAASGEKQQPVVKDKKIYPNDPCPCGSGKKYKKCCGRK